MNGFTSESVTIRTLEEWEYGPYSSTDERTASGDDYARDSMSMTKWEPAG